ncbi:MAG: hypothetical protein M1814_005226 [Vezdaea aestivalis]|nr:MAG: hypothetical protein M1814_005226 [Vezdaea aestivalis]
MHRLQIVSLVLGLVCTSSAHTFMSTFFVNGVSQGDTGTCVRMPWQKTLSGETTDVTKPVKDITSQEMVCGWMGNQGVKFVCPIEAAQTITFEYRHGDPRKNTNDALDRSHKGPCSVYMKKVTSAVKDNGAGDGWFKIFDEGYNSQTGKWCTEKLDDNMGHMSVKIPGDIQEGYYLVRSELLALHITGSPEFYIGCAQVYVTGGGSASPSGVSIPGYVNANDPALKYNIFAPSLPLPYPIPGPAVYASGNSKTSKLRSRQSGFSEGKIPSDCLLVSGNWCFREIAAYTDQISCSAAKTACYTALQECAQFGYGETSAGKNCDLLQPHCQAIMQSCDNGAKGPPNPGTVLTPAPRKIDVTTGEVTSGGIVSPGGSPGGNGGGVGGGSSAASSAGSSPSATPSIALTASGKKPLNINQFYGGQGQSGAQNPFVRTETVTQWTTTHVTVHVQATAFV